MATLKEVRQRIIGIHNTQKITKAMKIVAATKLKKHERLRKSAEVYTKCLETVVMNILKHSYHAKNPLLVQRATCACGGIVVISSDRGLCGGFNSNLFRKTVELIKTEQQCNKVVIVPIGKRAYDFFKKTGYEILFHEAHIEKRDLRAFSNELGDKLVKCILEGKVSRWSIASNRFTTKTNFGFSHDVLMPLSIDVEKERTESLALFEESPEEILNYLLPRYVSNILYHDLLESQTAEELARMLAMDYATENAEELISTLTLFYNRTRQQVITKEIAEIVGGAEALRAD